MVTPNELPGCGAHQVESYRLINSKFPPIALFDDVATVEEFEALYTLQALTNPRLRNEVGDLGLLPVKDIPFRIRGCSYATAPLRMLTPMGRGSAMAALAYCMSPIH